MPISHVLETCLYAHDLGAAEDFYARVFELEAMSRVAERHVFFRCGPGMLLIFNPDQTSTPSQPSTQGAVPPHGAVGPGHVAFAVPDAAIDRWRERLTGLGVEIEAEVSWPRGGRSLYVRDPAGNSVELATPRIWGLPEQP